MMRSWGNRDDTFVCDEPFYAYYLQATGIQTHPGREEILAGHETDWRKVVDWLTGPVPEGKPVFYQKQMAHHLLPDIEFDWVHQLTNCVLIREPREMLTSLIQFLPDPTLEETGLPQQWRLFEEFSGRAEKPIPVLDAKDVLDNPERLLRLLCTAVGVEFTEQMLSWPPGLRPTDGAWAPYWYDKVAETTSFGSYQPKPDQVPAPLQPLLEKSEAIYAKLYEHRLH